MAFMAAVGYLLWIRFEPLTAPTLMPAPAAVPLTPAALAELRAGHQQLQTRLEQVQAGLRELGAVVEAGEARLSGQMETLRTRPIASGETPEPAPPVAAQPKPVATQWLVNAGAFSEARQAAALGRRLTELGFAVRVEAQQADAEILHQVQITGFADRESAEGAARELTERLDLNGLWAAEAG
jgi:cell division septation protein DedD